MRKQTRRKKEEFFECRNEKNAPPKHDWATVPLLVGRVADEKCKLNMKSERHSMRWQRSLTANLTSRMTGAYEGVN